MKNKDSGEGKERNKELRKKWNRFENYS